MSGTFTSSLAARACRRAGRLVLAEGDDSRVREAARALARDSVAAVTLLGGQDTAAWAAAHAPAVACVDPARDPRLAAAAAHLLARRPGSAAGQAAARELAADPVRFAALLVALGEADAALAGAVATTAEVLRAALWALGPATGIRTVSSSFYMELADGRVLTFADCAVVQHPDASQLCDIAVSAAHDRGRIVGDEPRVAFLSHSTRGSAGGESVERVREAARIFRERTGLPSDGELQADAALVPAVAARKAPDSELKGNANVLIFPDLDSGNIAYKLVQRLAGATALGPIVQGLARPCCDLSRGASSDDIANVAAIALLQSQP
jgi:phosphate acetyltransferase